MLAIILNHSKALEEFAKEGVDYEEEEGAI